MTAMFSYQAPTRRADLLSILADHGAQARVLAGGTDLLGDVRKVDDDLLFKDTPSAPGILDDLPPSDKTGDYPPPPGAPAASGGG